MIAANLTSADVAAAFRVTAAVAESIREAGRIPSGTLYALLVGRVSLEAYHGIIRTLVSADLVREQSHELIWIGPKFGREVRQ